MKITKIVQKQLNLGEKLMKKEKRIMRKMENCSEKRKNNFWSIWPKNR